MNQFKTLTGQPAEAYAQDQRARTGAWNEYEHGIEAQLERATADGWRLIHTTSFTPISMSKYEKPTFYCLMEKP